MVDRQGDRQAGCIHREMVVHACPGRPPVSFRPDGHHGARLLRDPRRRADRDRRRDQARLPQARPAVAPGRQHGPERAGAVQGDQRGLPGPVRPGAPIALRHVRAGRGRRRRGRAGRRPGSRASVASPTSSMRSSVAARVRPRPGAAGRSPARTCATTCGSPSRRRSRGPRRRSSSPSSSAARRAAAAARKPGTEPITCPQCNGRGEVRSVRQTMLGQMVNVSACPRCRGEGKIIETPLRHVPGRRPDRAQADAPRHDPGRHRRGPPDPPLERGRGRAARRSARAACTSPSTSSRTRR